MYPPCLGYIKNYARGVKPPLCIPPFRVPRLSTGKSCKVIISTYTTFTLNVFKVLRLVYSVHYFIKKKMEELASSQTPATRIALRFFLFINICFAATKAALDVAANATDHRNRGVHA